MKIADLFVDLKLDSSGFSRDLSSTLRRAASSSITVKVDADTSLAQAKIARISGKTVTLNVDADTRAAAAKIDLAARDRRVKVEVNADSGTLASATRNMNLLTTSAIALGPALAPIAALSVGGIVALAPALGAAASAAGVAMLAFKGLGGALDALSNQHQNSGREAAAHAAAERSAASAVVGAQQAMAAARRAASQSAADDSAAVVAAQQDVRKAEAEGARASQQAAAQVASARRGVASATASASAGVHSALEAQAGAEESLQRAQESAKQAQEDLTKAREDAKRQLESYRLQVSGAALDQKQAQLDLVKAKQDLDKTLADPRASELERQQAQLSYQEQLQSLEEVAQRRKQLDADAAKARKKGVEGSDQVQAAKQAKRDAQQAVKDAQRNVTDAIKAVAKAQADGSRQIADAQRQVADALKSQADTEVANQDRIKSARDGVAKARQTQDRDAKDSADSIASAQRGLNDALANQKQVQDQALPSTEKLRDAMAGLSPAGQKFAIFLDSLRGKFAPLKAAAEGGLFPGLTKGIKAALPALKPATAAIGAIAKAMGDVGERAGKFIGGPFGRQFINLMGKVAPKLIRIGGRVMEDFGKIFVNVAVAGAPLMLKLANAILRLTDHLAKMSGQKGAFQPIINFAQKNGPLIFQTLSDIGRAFGRIVVAAIPIGIVVIKAIDGIAKGIAKIPMPVLTALIGLIGGLVTVIYAVNAAQRAWSAATNAYNTISSIWAKRTLIQQGLTKALTAVQAAFNLVMDANPIALVTLAIAGLIAVFILLFKHNKAFHDAVIATWDAIKHAIGDAWKNVIAPALHAMVAWIRDTLIPIVKNLWHNVVVPAFKAIAAIVKWAWDNVIKPVLHAYWLYITKVLAPIIIWLWKHVVVPAFKAIGEIIKWTWDHVIHPAFSAIVWYIQHVIQPVLSFLWHKVVVPVWNAIGSVIKGAWDNVISPAFSALRTGLDKVKDAFTAVRDWVHDKWGDIKDAAKKPVSFVVNTVIRDGIIAAVNKIPGIPDIKFAGVNFAGGGVMPGYTPGRDVHQFYSPTGGALALSGGEAIMRPEWTKAIGGESAVNKINKMAAQHKFARGGLFRPVRGGSVVQGVHDTSTGFPAIDIAVPIGTPVYAGHSGRVTVSKDLRGFEPRISHQNGYRSYGKYMQIAGSGMSTLYAHLSRRSLGAGTAVHGGQPIGLSGLTGHTYGPHLHFGARGVSPFAFLGGGIGHGFPGAAVAGSSTQEVGNLKDQQASAMSGIHPGEWVKALKKMGGFGDMLGGTAKSLASSGVDFIKEKFSALISKAKELASKVGHGISGFLHKINPWDGDDGHLSAADARGAGKKMMPAGWSWPALLNLWNGESGWRWNADNPNSSAYGIPQSLPGSKMASAGSDWHDNAITQIKWGLGYIGSRYGDSQTAYREWQGRSPHWYARGGKVRGPGTGTSDSILARVSTGEYIVPAHAVPENEELLNAISGFAKGGKVKAAAAAAARARAFNTVDSVRSLINSFKVTLDRTKFAAGMKKLVSHLTSPKRRAELRALVSRLSAKGGVLAKVRTAQANVNSLKSQRSGLVADLHDTIAPNIADFAQTPGGILGGLKAQVAAVQRFKTGLANLAKDGFPKALILQVAGLGLADGAAAAEQLHGLNTADRGQVTKLFNQLSTDATSKGAAGQIGDAVFGNAIKQATADLKKLPTDKSVVAAMAALGGHIVDGFLAALHLPKSKKPKATHDAGGWLEKGRSLTVNNTGKAEAVLTSPQWSMIGRLVSAVEQGRNGTSAPLIGHAVIRENVDLERYERQRAFRDRSTRI